MINKAVSSFTTKAIQGTLINNSTYNPTHNRERYRQRQPNTRQRARTNHPPPAVPDLQIFSAHEPPKDGRLSPAPFIPNARTATAGVPLGEPQQIAAAPPHSRAERVARIERSCRSLDHGGAGPAPSELFRCASPRLTILPFALHHSLLFGPLISGRARSHHQRLSGRFADLAICVPECSPERVPRARGTCPCVRVRSARHRLGAGLDVFPLRRLVDVPSGRTAPLPWRVRVSSRSVLTWSAWPCPTTLAAVSAQSQVQCRRRSCPC